MERIRDFAAIDFETANGQRTSVCSVGVVVVRGGRPSESIYRLIRIVRGVAIRNHDSRAALAMCLAIAVGVCGLSTPITDYPIPTTVSCVR